MAELNEKLNNSFTMDDESTQNGERMAELNGKLNNGFTKDDESTQDGGTSLKLEVIIPAPPPVTVVGSGEFGQALSTCLTRAGHKVLIASRNPDRLSLDPRVGTAIALADGMAASQVVVMAVPRSVLTDLLKHQALHGKIVIDVSNRTDTSKLVSQYDSLGEEAQAETHPDTRVVKAFNTLSAYALRSGVQQGGKQVPFCGNDAQAKQVVGELIRSLGYTPEDRGDIRQSRELEDIPFAFFEGWLFPLLLAFAIFIFFYTVMLFRNELCPHWDDGRPWDKSNFDRLILLQTHLCIALTALTLLVSCYTPGVLAAYLQLYRGTKYSRFPRWLDRWLQSRKQMGLIALQLALTHAFAVLSRPEYQGKWRISSVYLTGVFSFGLMVILGVSSLPSVGATLSWREFNFLQRWGGWSALTFATLHAIFVKWDKLIENVFRCVVIPNQVQIVVILPLLTILFKLPLLLPWIDRRLMDIRAGKTS